MYKKVKELVSNHERSIRKTMFINALFITTMLMGHFVLGFIFCYMLVK